MRSSTIWYYFPVGRLFLGESLTPALRNPTRPPHQAALRWRALARSVEPHNSPSTGPTFKFSLHHFFTRLLASFCWGEGKALTSVGQTSSRVVCQQVGNKLRFLTGAFSAYKIANQRYPATTRPSSLHITHLPRLFNPSSTGFLLRLAR